MLQWITLICVGSGGDKLGPHFIPALFSYSETSPLDTTKLLKCTETFLRKKTSGIIFHYHFLKCFLIKYFVILGLNTFDQKNKTRHLLNINQIPWNICLDLIKELVSQQLEENTVEVIREMRNTWKWLKYANKERMLAAKLSCSPNIDPGVSSMFR